MQIVGMLTGNAGMAFPRPAAKALSTMAMAGAGGPAGAGPGMQGAPFTPGTAPETGAAGLGAAPADEHPVWGVLDKLAGNPGQRAGFAEQHPETMHMLRTLFQ